MDPVTLTHRTLLTLIRWRQADPHPVLAATPTWYDDDALLALDQQARDELAHHHLIGPRGRLDPDFEDAIDVLVRPEREHYGWINATIDGQTRAYGLLAVAAYKVALLLVHAGDHVALTTVRPSGLTDEFVAQLPATPPAKGEPISLPYDDYVTATETGRDEFVGFRVRQNPTAHEVRGILTRPRTGAGNLYTATRANGNRHRVKHPVNYIDTSGGRWLTVLTTAGDQLTASLTPATPELIAHQLRSAPVGPAG
jgi:hypothetical protein